MTYANLHDQGLDGSELRAALAGPGSLWRDVRVIASTPSTNADLAAAAGRGEPEGLVEVAEFQSAGRGRLGRTWVAPSRTALTFSVLLRPAGVPPPRWSWLPLLAGVAAASAVDECTGLAVRLKWPNDLLVGERKLAGVLAERAGNAVVLGIGLNVALGTDELPRPDATSLLLEAAGTTDRSALLIAILRALGRWYERWSANGADPTASGLADAYRARCATLGRAVQVTLPSGAAIHGTATGIGEDGALTIREPDGTAHTLAAGDVAHVRVPGTGSAMSP